MSSTTRTLLAGTAVAVTGALVVDHGAAFGTDLPAVALLGVAAGAVLGLLGGISVAARAVGFVTGVLAAAVGLYLLAHALPDAPSGRALAALAVGLLVTGVSVASAGRVPLWSGFLGVSALMGGYATAVVGNPAADVGDPAVASAGLTTVLLSAAIGFGVAVATSGSPAPVPLLRPEPPPATGKVRAVPVPRGAADDVTRRGVTS